MNVQQQYDSSTEPPWVTQTVRLFPHPVFAAAVSIACALVAAIFTLGALTGGPWVLCGVVAIAFATGAYFVAAATIVRRRYCLKSTRLQQKQLTGPVPPPATVIAAQMNDDALFNNKDRHDLPPIPTWKLLLYLATVLVWEAQIAVVLIRMLGGIQLDPIWRQSVLGLWLIVTLLAARYGRHDLQRVQMSRGRVELTGKQAVLVTVLFVSFGGTAGVVFAMLRDKL